MFKPKELFGLGDDNEVRERFMFKGRGGKYKASARRLFHSILGFLAPNGFNVVLTAFLKHAGVKDYRKHIPSRKLLAKMMIEMRDISIY